MLHSDHGRDHVCLKDRERMRAGLVIYNSLDTLSGGYLYDRQLVNTLRAAGDEVEIISLPWSHYQRHLLHNLRPSLLQRLQHGRFDILLQDELNHPSLFLINEQLRRRSPAPIISIVHHLRSSENHSQRQLVTYRRVERRYLRSLDGQIFNSETTRAAAESLAGESRPSVVAHPAADHVGSALDEEQLNGRLQENKPLRLLFAGNVIPRKGLHTLLAALDRLPGEPWELAIVGDLSVNNAYSRLLWKQVSSASTAHRVTWHGRVADERLWDLMAGSDLLVVPSSYEGFGIVYLEGMAFGLPAIATTAGAAGELITDGVNGFLVAPHNAGELARRIQLLLRDRRLLRQMSLAALEKYHASPTWSQNMSAVRRFLLHMRR